MTTAGTAGTIGKAASSPLDRVDIWQALAAPIPAGEVQWRQNGRPKSRDGKFFAPFVAYIDAQFVRDRFDEVVPGEWDLTLDLLPPLLSTGGDGEANDAPCAFKARLQVLGVIREDVGAGHDYKQASTDAFKRAAVRFGVGRELYTDYEIVWVQVDGEGKYAKALDDPAAAWARKQGRSSGANGAVVKSATAGTGDTRPATRPEATPETPASQQGAPVSPLASDEMMCPKCGGRTWDNRLTKRNPRAPDFKCRDSSCDGVIWPPKGDKAAAGVKPGRESDAGPHDDAPAPDDADFLPF